MNSVSPTDTALWPALPFEAWKDTYATLHMWTQVVGKVALAHSPPVNHSWGVALSVTPRGLSTALLPYGNRSFTMEFDFVDHRFLIQTSDGSTRTIPLRPMSVADFYRGVMSTLDDMSLSTRIWSLPSEVPDPIRFEEDLQHHSYEPVYANRFWRILTEVERVFTLARSGFVGKTSPVHFFWGGFDLAVTRFSGRRAPARSGPGFMQEAYSHEVISHGIWPGSGAVTEMAFYAYAAPEPPGLDRAQVNPDGAYYNRELGEFILPYERVRVLASPEKGLKDFIDSTYEAAATLAHWDRASLERQR